MHLCWWSDFRFYETSSVLSFTTTTSAKVSGISELTSLSCSVFRGQMTDFDIAWRFSWLSEFLCCTTIRSCCIETFDFVPKVAFFRIYWQARSWDPALSLVSFSTDFRDIGRLMPDLLFMCEKFSTLGGVVDCRCPLRWLFRLTRLSSLTIARGCRRRCVVVLLYAKSLVLTIVGCSLNKLVCESERSRLF